MKKRKYVSFYARSEKYNNDNYNFKFKVNDKNNALYTAKKFKAKSAWYIEEINGVVVVNNRIL